MLGIMKRAHIVCAQEGFFVCEALANRGYRDRGNFVFNFLSTARYMSSFEPGDPLGILDRLQSFEQGGELGTHTLIHPLSFRGASKHRHHSPSRSIKLLRNPCRDFFVLIRAHCVLSSCPAPCRSPRRRRDGYCRGLRPHQGQDAPCCHGKPAPPLPCCPRGGHQGEGLRLTGDDTAADSPATAGDKSTSTLGDSPEEAISPMTHARYTPAPRSGALALGCVAAWKLHT